MKRLILVILLAVPFCPKANFACSCIEPSSFCESITDENGELIPNTILRGTTKAVSPGIKKIKVNQLIFGTTGKSEITISGNGFCTLFFHEIEDNQEYIFALTEHNGDFLIQGCAIYFLKIENEIVKGKIAPGITSLPYPDLGALPDCGNAFAGIDLINSVSLFPNPTLGALNIKNLSSETSLENIEVEIFDALGRRVFEQKKSDAILPEEIWSLSIEKLRAGVYFLKISGNYREGFFKIVKQ